ncbi:MAG TPA: 4-(cytidine 5'-diphospho)-2-C-methyl-D-erythritol kinase [Chthonomonadaceae bacterium]|nr:4-(cytidine 5'-diphospho)-2-C-methyl-D-erythritol kinase [Chthonomonadaceae bacterium]
MRELTAMNRAASPSLTVASCAKINLTLDVFSKRADGYHSLASVMQAVSLADTLHLTLRAEPGIAFTCEAPETIPVPTDATNLAVRAAAAAIAAAAEAGRKIETGVAIHLVKRIPAQAGLGGGSSNAAAALRGVNALLGLNLDAQTLHRLAASLGSDVPFFLTGGTAAARGRGESITPLPDAPTLWLVVVKPEENVSTAWAYGELDAMPDRASHRATKRMEAALRAGDHARLIAWQSNDFELPVFTHFPRLAWLHDELRMAGALTAHLCGSGSALYGVAPDEAAAQRIASLFQSRYPQVAVARTLTRAESDPLKGAECG